MVIGPVNASRVPPVRILSAVTPASVAQEPVAPLGVNISPFYGAQLNFLVVNPPVGISSLKQRW